MKLANHTRGRRSDPLIDALVEQTGKPRRTLLNARYTVTAASALGPGAAALPVKVQVELGRLLVLEGWLDSWTESLSPAYLAGADTTVHHTPEIRQWLASTGMAELPGIAWGLLASGLGADGAAQKLRNGRLAHEGRAGRGTDPRKAARRMAAAIRREAEVHGMSLAEFIQLMPL